MFGDAGLVTLGPEDYGKLIQPSHRNLQMSILRTPHNVVPEPEPEHVSDWGRTGVTANGQLIALSDATDDALDAIDKAGPRGAAALGVLIGAVVGGWKGGLIGGGIGYFGGSYLANLARKAVTATRVASAVAKVGS